MRSIEDWWAGGERVPLPSGHEVFTRVDGAADAPWLTLVHGFPTSSYDWAPIVDRLAGERRLLSLDLLGFGDSDKPRGHRYDLLEQAGAIDAVWRHYGVQRTALAVHDYGVSVGQELLAREGEERLPAALTAAAFLNGGMLPELHRPLGIQRALAHPVSGPVLTRLVSERTFRQGMRRIFAREPSDAELHQLWLGVVRRGGRTGSHALLRYLEDRREHAARWRAAVAETAVPLHFVWGPLDPISGAHMLAGLRDLRPDATFVELEGVGHYPQLEDADGVAEALRALAG